MAQFEASTIEVDRTYTVTGAEPVLDSARSPIDPETARVHFTTRRGGALIATSVLVKGRRLQGQKTKNTYKDGYFHITPDGTVLPDHRDYLPPDWVGEIARLAIAAQDAADAPHRAATAG